MQREPVVVQSQRARARSGTRPAHLHFLVDDQLTGPELRGWLGMERVTRKAVAVILLAGLLLGVLHYYTLSNRTESLGEETKISADSSLRYKQPSVVHGRTDVVSVTPWLAPVVWEGTFYPVLIDSIYQRQNVSIAATVFAVGKYVQFLKNFLETAEQFFFVGFDVHVYVFTDQPDAIPDVRIADGRQLTVRSVPSSNRWQEISARRMELIQALIEETLLAHADYIFCLDVDSKFHGRWGAESLSGLVAVLHPGYYEDGRSRLPYERRPQSRAYMAPEDGDFYYCGGAFGGSVQEVLLLTQTCRHNFEADAREGIEAAWQEESHLNKYMWIHKPTKVLSPEYLWQDFHPRDPKMHIIRFSGVVKNYADIRPNV
ncbi:globoside alpha-1,3-N-acetylgalactosaminyltransferase 1-like isoform X2 [Antennarius striatus]|uniref:globoside alpha-1,3-N-acetylgalactosaminyltransferase 1-like isoform X2 n=1 Tax=Antennarius striatus TaxID=241820 RepID=UPI0035B45B6E